MLRKNNKEELIKDYILKALNTEKTLEELLNETSKKLSIPKYYVIKAIEKLIEEEKIYLEEPKVRLNFLSYLFSYHSTWFFLVLLVNFMTLIAIYIMPQTFPLIYIRYVFASIFLLYLPGYTLVEVLFPKKDDMGGLERFALSVGMSVAIAPLIGYVFNFTPWGIRLEPILVSLIILTISLSSLALIRKHHYYKLSKV